MLTDLALHSMLVKFSQMQNRSIFMWSQTFGLHYMLITEMLTWCTWTIRYKVPCIIQTWCFRGRWELHWVLPSGIPKVYHGTQIEETGCGKKNNQYCSRLTLSPALAQHTGSYRCRYRQKQRKQASVYVYVTGKMLQVNAGTLESSLSSLLPWNHVSIRSSTIT